MGFRFLHAADLHIDSPLHGLSRYEEAPADRIRTATRRAFLNLVRHAIDLRVAFVVLAGDVFDGDWRDFGTGLWFCARMRELTQEGIAVYLVSGNHDAASRMTSNLPLPEGVYAFPADRPATLVHEPTRTRLHGQGFARPAVTEDLASGYPPAVEGALNIGILHTALSGREGHEPYAPCSKETLIQKGYGYWALGHVHAREIVHRDPWIVFPGNLQGRHAREAGAKGAFVATVEDHRIAEVAFEPMDVARYASLRADLTACPTLEACLSEVERALEAAAERADGRMLAARIRLEGRPPCGARLVSERERFQSACREVANALPDVWIEKVLFSIGSAPEEIGADLADELGLYDDELIALARAASREAIAELRAALPGRLLEGELAALLDEESPRDSLMRRAAGDLLSRLAEARRRTPS